MIKVNNDTEVRVSQGDILKNVEYYESVEEIDGHLIISKIVFPYVVVLSQDCDLQWDNEVRDKKIKDEEEKNKDKETKNTGPKTEDKKLISMIVVPLYNADHFFKGEHLSTLELTMITLNRKKTEGKDVLRNTNPRYHYLQFTNEIEIPDSVIDFKHYFTINIDKIKSKIDEYKVATISELYREQISHRFSHYLSRIGLPEN